MYDMNPNLPPMTRFLRNTLKPIGDRISLYSPGLASHVEFMQEVTPEIAIAMLQEDGKDVTQIVAVVNEERRLLAEYQKTAHMAPQTLGYMPQYGMPNNAPQFAPPTGLPQAAPQYSNMQEPQPLATMPQLNALPDTGQPMHPAVQMQHQAAQVAIQTPLNPIPQVSPQAAMNALPPAAQALAQPTQPAQPTLVPSPTGAIPQQGTPYGMQQTQVPNIAPQATNPAPQPVMLQPMGVPQMGTPQMGVAGQPLGAAPPALPPSTTLTMANPGDTSTLAVSMFPQQTS